MPVVALFEFPGESVEKYHKVFEIAPEVVDQPKRLSHVCFERPDGGFTVVDVWESEDAVNEFGPIIGPATAQAGLDARPQILKIHRTMP